MICAICFFQVNKKHKCSYFDSHEHDIASLTAKYEIEMLQKLFNPIYHTNYHL